ncbi:hypothetical protein [Corynebacterium sp.]|uniref:hypothetical protein n=1 Tax=Corynebacterium sp. TaxID=1720 RepID=UPI0026DAA788|nr:hypothetical protein [Corynebacterium sp.]MDO5076456.1 hypothetical protein [Corynebacterium sp.]
MRLMQCCVALAVVGLAGCSNLASDRTTVPLVTDTSTPAVGLTPAPKATSSTPKSEELARTLQEVPSDTFIANGLHTLRFDTGGDTNGYCTLMADTFTCSGVPEDGGDTNEVSVAPEGITYLVGSGPPAEQELVCLNPGEFTEVESVRCSMLDASTMMCSGPGGTISINGPEHIVHEQAGN